MGSGSSPFAVIIEELPLELADLFHPCDTTQNPFTYIVLYDTLLCRRTSKEVMLRLYWQLQEWRLNSIDN